MRPFLANTSYTSSGSCSLPEIRATEELPDTLSSLKQRVNELDLRHTRDLERLYDHQAQRYLDDAYDRYLQYDDTQVGPESRAEFVEQLDVSGLIFTIYPPLTVDTPIAPTENDHRSSHINKLTLLAV